ncbi:citrate synthase-like protein [Aspergillus oleicola]
MPLTGHCLCGAVTYKAEVDKPLITAYDHCDDCQRQSGSTYSLVTVVPKDSLTINGPVKSYAKNGSSGQPVHRIFCSECGSPIAHDPEAAPPIIALKAGTLDSEIKKTLQPDTEIWTVGKLPFCQEKLEHPFDHMPHHWVLNCSCLPVSTNTMSSGTLYVKDSRTGLQYEIPIRKNAVSAKDFKKIKALGSGANRADQPSGGLRVHDPGLCNTTVVESAISFSDHDTGLLLFRGYSLEELWNSDFEDMLYLLVWGSYPTAQQKEDIRVQLAKQMLAVPESVQKAVQSLPVETPPLALMLTGLSTYLACLPVSIPASTSSKLYQGNHNNVDHAVLRTVAGYAVVFGIVSSHRKGIKFTPPSLDNNYCENLFTMAGLVDHTTGKPDPVKLSCFRRFAMLNADHGMALAVFSALVTASSLTDPISCLITSVTSAWGPLHFGATESAQRALNEIGTVDRIPAFLDEVKQGHKRLFGYGHRSYKGVDPRVRPIQSILKDLPSTRLLKLAEAIEQAASGDQYFRKRSLHPNADFYGNFVFTGIGFELEMIPAAMLAQRIMGIMAHWREYMLTCGKLVRPSHLYTGDAREDSSQSCSSTSSSGTSVPKLKSFQEYTTRQKRLIILKTTLASTFSPLSSNIYYPALNSLARELHVSAGKVNLSITSYMICQALAPQITSPLSDSLGRKPLYIVCLSTYIATDIALATSHTYTSLIVLRALQSTCISGTVALSAAVAADLVENHERGKYMAFTGIGNVLAPSLGPVLGGLLVEYSGWRGVFWGLSVGASVVLIAVVLGVPETMGYRDALKRQQCDEGEANKKHQVAKNKDRAPSLLTILKRNPLSSLSILLHPPTTLLLLSNGLVFAAYYAVTTGIPLLFKAIYGLSDMGIGLVFVSAGIGSLVSAIVGGRVVDWNYRRCWKKHGQVISNHNGGGHVEEIESQGQSQTQKQFSVEHARLQIGGPMTIISALAILTYGLILSQHPPLGVSLVLIFLVSFSVTASYNVMNVLLVDLYYSTPATAMATNNFVRCFLGAASTALVTPMIERVAFAGGNPLPPDLPILEMRHPGSPWVNPGDTLLMSETHPRPEISTWGLHSNSTHLMVCVDLDVQYGNAVTVILHWYQADMVIHDRDTWLKPGKPKEGELNKHSAEYIAPQPPPNTHHRYVYLAFEQHEEYTFPECFQHIFPKTMEARAGFDLHQFVAVTGLQRPVAGNYFFVTNDEDKDVTGTSTMLSASQTTTWVRSADCSQPPTATATTSADVREHVRGASRRQAVM